MLDVSETRKRLPYLALQGILDVSLKSAVFKKNLETDKKLILFIKGCRRSVKNDT